MSKEGKLIIKKVNNSVTASLYNTTIVKVMDGNKVVLNSGGWKTSLTKRSINRILDSLQIPIHVFTHEGEWKVTYTRDGVIASFNDGKEYIY